MFLISVYKIYSILYYRDFLEYETLDNNIFFLLFCDVCTLWIPILDKQILYCIFFYQIISYIACIVALYYMNKDCPDIFKYVFTYVAIACIITLTFGMYYYQQGIIPEESYIIVDSIESNFFVINYYNSVMDLLYFYISIFFYSMQFYVNYTTDFVQQVQFVFGIIISGLLLSTVFTQISKYLTGD